MKMPTQADIRNYIVPANNNVESTSQVMNLADSVHSELDKLWNNSLKDLIGV